MITTIKLQKAIVTALEDIKATDIEVFDVRHITAMFDKVIIASAGSGRQLKALSNNVLAKVKAAGGRVYGVEGENSDDWMLVDAGDIVVHVMQPAMRVHYNLEELWNQPRPRAERAPRTKDDTRAARPAAIPMATSGATSGKKPATKPATKPSAKTSATATRARKPACTTAGR